MNTQPKKFCFVLMPFESDFDDIYNLGIKQSCIDAGTYCERVDEQIFEGSILERIYNQISKADIVIADMTNRNPNVFYEVGYAHALGKTTILLTQNQDDIPFDLKHYPHIIYNNKITKLKDELTKRVKWCVSNDNVNKAGQKVELDIYLNDKSLSNKNVEFIVKDERKINFTIHNNSFITYKPYDYSIGIITDENYRAIYKDSNKEFKKTILPDGKLLHSVPVIDDILYPNSYASFIAIFVPEIVSSGNDGAIYSPKYYDEDQEIIIRVFTQNGTRDFYLWIKYEK